MVQLTQASWGNAKSKRKEKYAYWKARGYSDYEARQARDWGFKRARAATGFVGPRKPIPKKIRTYDADEWSKASQYWQANKKGKKQLKAEFGWGKGDIRRVNSWAKKAIAINKKKWDEQQDKFEPAYIKEITGGDALWWEHHHAGFGAVYFNVIDGLDDFKAYARCSMDLDREEPDEY